MKSTRESRDSSQRRCERRIGLQFDKAFPVMVGSELFGDAAGVARNISPGGMLVEMPDPVPLGSTVTVRFRMPEGTCDISALAEVKHHYCLNFAYDHRLRHRLGHEPEHEPGHELGRARGVGLRFVEFMAEGAEQWMESFARIRVLH